MCSPCRAAQHEQQQLACAIAISDRVVRRKRQAGWLRPRTHLTRDITFAKSVRVLGARLVSHFRVWRMWRAKQLRRRLLPHKRRPAHTGASHAAPQERGSLSGRAGVCGRPLPPKAAGSERANRARHSEGSGETLSRGVVRCNGVLRMRGGLRASPPPLRHRQSSP